MHLTSTLAAVLAFVAAARALPGGSPLCTVDGVAAKLTNSMGANAGVIPCTITADKTNYDLGGTITLTWACTDIDNFQGFLAYASPATDANKKVGAFTLADGLKSNKALCGDTAEQDTSVVTHSAPGKFSPNGSISYTAPSTDVGNLNFNFVVVKKVDAGFRWGVFANAVTISSPGGASGAEATQTVDAFSCSCPTPMPVSVIRKCTPKALPTTKVMVTKFKTMTETSTMTKTKTKTNTETVRVTQTCDGTVAGGEETPQSSMMEHETSMMEHRTTTMMHEKTTKAKDEYGSTPTPTAVEGGAEGGYGGYSSYSDDDEEEDDEY